MINNEIQEAENFLFQNTNEKIIALTNKWKKNNDITFKIGFLKEKNGDIKNKIEFKHSNNQTIEIIINKFDALHICIEITFILKDSNSSIEIEHEQNYESKLTLNNIDKEAIEKIFNSKNQKEELINVFFDQKKTKDNDKKKLKSLIILLVIILIIIFALYIYNKKE